MKMIRKQEMDIDECVSSLRNRVRQLHPWNPEGIVAYIVSRKTPEEIREYVLASDDQIRHLIVEAKSFSVPPEQQFLQLPPLQPPSRGHGLQFPHSQLQFHPSSSFCGSQAPFPPFDQIGPWQPQFQPSGNFDVIQAPFAPNVPTAPCHFHLSMGCCKKGEDCRFSHESGFPEMHTKRQVHTLESLPMLEKEIRELLFSLQPPRVPIESLASIYIERYGKPLRVEGFGAEGQQHGKAYYNLIGLLLRLNTTRVIERQGQHYIVPVEDAPKFLADDFKLVMPSAIYDSNKIYITFEPKSTFSKQDAWNYFSRYGPVHDVRIPLRQKRMFGYVSFLYPETVKRILSERSRSTPHFIGVDQVFVKACKKKHELEKLAQEDAHSNSGSHQLSDANVIYEHHTGESISSHRELFREKLNDERDLGIVTEKSSVNNVPEMASPPTHNLHVHSVNKAGPLLVDNMAESSHVSDRLDDAPATQDCDDYGLPENLDDIYL